VKIPDGSPPKELQIEDISKGSGAEVKAGDTVTVQYVGVSWSTGKQFDSSWDRGEPATFPLGNVIEGWQEGIPGMKEGGRRRLTIPPDKAYGAEPPPGSGIAPNETLVFVIDLIDVQ
jgi:peptidylprolyl isomerase